MRPLDPRLLHRATAARFFLVAVAVVGLATALLVLAQAWFLSQAVASVFDTHATALARSSVPVLLAIFAARGLLSWANSVLAQRASAQVKSQLRTDVAAARLARPGDTSVTSTSVSTLVSTELDALDGYFAKYLPQLVLAVVVPVVMIVAIALQDWPSALIILATIPLIPVFMILIGWTTKEQVARRFRVQNRLANHFADLVAGLPTLQVFGRARGQLKGLAATEDASRTQTMATLRIAFLSAGVLEMAATLSVAIVAVTLGFRVIDGGMDLATSLFVLMLAPEAYLPIRQVGVHFHDSANGQAAADAALAVIEDADAHAGTGTGTPASGPDVGAAAGRRVVQLSRRRPAGAQPPQRPGHPGPGRGPGRPLRRRQVDGPAAGDGFPDTDPRAGSWWARTTWPPWTTPPGAVSWRGWVRIPAWCVAPSPTTCCWATRRRPPPRCVPPWTASGAPCWQPTVRWATTARDCPRVSADASRWLAPCCGSSWAVPGCWWPTSQPPALTWRRRPRQSRRCAPPARRP